VWEFEIQIFVVGIHVFTTSGSLFFFKGLLEGI
jgi:hypothetical protein